MTTVRRVLLAMLLPLIALPAAAQSPNTSALIVVVVDQTGAVVNDAKVTVVNSATGATREAVSGRDGSATISALPLTGTYTVQRHASRLHRRGRDRPDAARRRDGDRAR